MNWMTRGLVVRIVFIWTKDVLWNIGMRILKIFVIKFYADSAISISLRKYIFLKNYFVQVLHQVKKK